MTRDLTTGRPAKLILLFTIPLLIGNIFQQFYSMADTLIVGRTISVEALASVGCTGSIVFLVLGFAQGLTSGLSIITARRFGADDHEGMRRSVAAGMYISIAVTVLLTVVAVPMTRIILTRMQTPPELMENAYRYLVIIFAGTAASVLFNLLSNLIRAVGDSKTPLMFLVIACILNIILDFVLILVFSMGVAGAAVATVIAQLASGLLCLLYIRKRFPVLWLSKEDFRVSRPEILQHLKIALPMAFQMSIIAIGAIMLQFALNGLGSVAVAAYTAAQRIDMMATQPMMSFGTTMATYTAQNYGAGKYHRIRQGVRQCSAMSIGFSIAVGIVMILAGGSLVSIFVGSGQTEVLNLAKSYLRINGSLYWILAMLFIFRFTLQGLGKTFVPTIAGIMELIMRAVAAIFFAQLYGFIGAVSANPLAWIGAWVPLTIAYLLTSRRLLRKESLPSQDI